MIAVKNFSGLISVNPDGSWVCEGYSKRKTEHHPDPVSLTPSMFMFIAFAASSDSVMLTYSRNR